MSRKRFNGGGRGREVDVVKGEGGGGRVLVWLRGVEGCMRGEGWVTREEEE